jgi:aconitate hydratase
VLAILGDSITTDHISPAGIDQGRQPGRRYLLEHQVRRADFNSYGARRGNHEVMMRGTFANIRIKNEMVPGIEGGITKHTRRARCRSTTSPCATRPTAPRWSIFAGKEYGTGSSRDWAAKGTFLLGVRAVIAESFERIHRSNLVGMGVLPLQFAEGVDRKTLGLDGTRPSRSRPVRTWRARHSDNSRTAGPRAAAKGELDQIMVVRDRTIGRR